MNLLFMANNGLPRNGLVALYDMGKQIALGNTGQTLVDFSGHANNAQLGSTAGADTNDPAWSGQGLTFGADDYAMLPTMPELDITKNWTAIFAVNSGAAGTARCIWQKGVSTSNRMSINISLANEIIAETYNGTTYSGKSLSGANGNTNYIITADCANNNLSLRVNDRGQDGVSIFSGSSIVGNNIGMGKNGTVFFNGGIVYCGCFYNRLLSDTEYMQAYNYLRRLMMSRGVSIG